MATRILIPDPLNTDADYGRFYHHDVSDMEVSELLDELYGIRPQVWMLKSDRSRRLLGWHERDRRLWWLRERLSQIEAELRHRPYGTWNTKGQAKPEGVKSVGVKV